MSTSRPSDWQIKTGLLDNPQVLALLEAHLKGMQAASPPESTHALDVSGLKEATVTFWSLWSDQNLLGCGALKQHSEGMAEIKSMKTHDAHLRKGVAEAMLVHILQFAKQQGIKALYLETGSMASFRAAHRLYQKHGFEICDPFADYVLDPNSLFFRRML